MSFIHGIVTRERGGAGSPGTIDAMRHATGDHPWSARAQAQVSDDPVVNLAVDVSRFPYPREPAGVVTDSDASIVFDGRLFEAPAIGGAASDAAAIIATYRRDPQSLSQLRGEAAFALWDGLRGQLVLWRDPAGVRPLYYHHAADGQRLAFSSDLRALVAISGVGDELDLQQVRNHLAWDGYLSPDRTLLADVRRLPAGHLLTWDGRAPHEVGYWPDPSAPGMEPTGSLHAQAMQLREAVDAAVRERLPAGHAVGAHLSGGLDSSSVAVLAARGLEDPQARLPTFSWAPPRTELAALEFDERRFAELAATGERIDHHFTISHRDDIVELATSDLTRLPVTTLHAERSVQRQAETQGIGTILSGWGGDETVAFNGRGLLASLARRGRIGQVQRELRRRQDHAGSGWVGGWKGRVLLPLLPDAALRVTFPGQLPRPKPLPPELRPALREQLAQFEPAAPPILRERSDPRAMQRALWGRGHLQYRMEAWAAHGERHGVRYSFPLVDRQVVELAWRLSPALYFHDGWKRWGYRTAMDGVLPDEVRWLGVKFDSAYQQHLQQLVPASREASAERILTRRDNPHVDVDLLREVPSGHVGHPSLGEGAWLAFVDAGS